MLSQSQNGRLTQTGPGTPLGELYRRSKYRSTERLGKPKFSRCHNRGVRQHCVQGGTDMVTPRKLGHVGIYVRDLDKSKKFYGEVVGLKISDELPGLDDRSRPADQWRRLDHV